MTKNELILLLIHLISFILRPMHANSHDFIGVALNEIQLKLNQVNSLRASLNALNKFELPT